MSLIQDLNLEMEKDAVRFVLEDDRAVWRML
jgi:hypothetical protein